MQYAAASRWTRRLGAIAILLSSGVEAADCNSNGIEDSQELLGAFFTAETIPLGAAVREGDVADLNGDGFLDLAVSGLERVTLALNDGEGNLRFAPGAPGDQTCIAVAAVNVDGDEDVDLLTLGKDSRKVFVFKNDGDAKFTPAGQFGTGFSGSSNALSHGDLDGDGDRDLVATSRDAESPAILWNDGNGGFEVRTNLPLERQQQDVKVGLINGDALPDVVVLTYGIIVFLNQGGGAFTPLPLVRDDPYTAYTFELGDMNGDGTLDIVTAGSDVRIHPNDGSGAPGPSMAFPIRDISTSMALGDIDMDGDLDVALPHEGEFTGEFENKLSFLRNDGEGVLGGEDGFLVGNGPGSALFLDAENDGDEDLITVNLQSATLLRNDGQGRFRTARYVPVTKRPQSIAPADFDGDGTLDLVVGEDSSWNFTMLWNNGGGRFEPDSTFIVQAWPGFNQQPPGHVEAADVSGDGRPDIVTGSYVVFNLGDRKFRARFEPFDQFGGFTFHEVALGDIDGDSSLDAAGFSRTRNAIVLARNGGQGIFTKIDELDASEPGFSLVLADLNADGLLDIAAGLERRVAIYLRLEDGSFAIPVEHPGVSVLHQLETIDLDRDGILDLVGSSDLDLSILWGQGEGTFETPLNLTYEARHVDFFDEGSDGETDIAMVTDEGLTVLVNKGGRNLVEGTTVRYGLEPNVLTAGDMDGDGGTDFAIVDFRTADVGILFAGRPAATDCNGNGVPDGCDALTGDCDANGTPDVCDLETRSVRIGKPSVYDTRSGNISAVRPVDLSGDEVPDLLVAAGVGEASIAVLENDGAGRFIFRSGRFLRGIHDLVPAYLDGDAILDLAATTIDSDKYDPQTPQSHSLHVLLGLGGFNYSPAEVHPVGRNPVAIVAADLDSDGDVDLATGNQVSFADRQSPDPALKDITLLGNNGDGTFVLVGGLTIGTRVGGLAGADLNRDGKEDLLAATVGPESGDIVFLHNDGSGRFLNQVRVPGGSSPGSLVARDYDSDGDLDTVVGNWGAGGLQMIRYMGSGGFESAPLRTDGILGTQPVTAADWEGDGDFDLAVGGLSLLVNDGEGDFSLGGNMAAPTLGLLTAVDVNHDGRPDLVGSVHGTRNVLVALNETPRFLEPDCNANGIPDACDRDTDSDGVPDSCDLCPGQDDRVDEDLDGQPECLAVSIRLLATEGAFRPFLRADTNQSGQVDLSDAVATLNYLFLGDAAPGCIRAMDANRDRTVDISDATFALAYLFLGGTAIPEPYPECGGDLEPDGLGCQVFRGCMEP